MFLFHLLHTSIVKPFFFTHFKILLVIIFNHFHLLFGVQTEASLFCYLHSHSGIGINVSFMEKFN